MPLGMPRWFTPALLITTAVALVPLALIARARATHSAEPRVHFVWHMDSQPKFKAQSENPLFADGRAMRPPVPGTVARGELEEDDHLYRGRVENEWAEEFPRPVTMAMLRRGRERFGIYCSPCHGLDGEGGGMVAVRAERLQEGSWIPPVSFHTDVIRGRPVGLLFNTITHGARTMPPYGPQIPVEDRWAIVAYLRALQRSHYASIEDVPEDRRDALR
jgi:mono/diheme cytochrome c family protein